MRFTQLLTIALALLILPRAKAQTPTLIAAPERIDWTIGKNVGVRNGVRLRTQIYRQIAAGADVATINAAIQSCPDGEVVKLAAGDFTLTAAIRLRSNVTLRGSGIGATRLHSTTTSLITISGVPTVSAPGDVTGGYATGSTSLTLSGSPAVSPGDFIGVYQDNESWMYDPDGHQNDVYSMYRVESVTGSTIQIWPSLVYGASNVNPKFVKLTGNLISGASVEELSVYPESSDISFPIVLSTAYGCWLRDIEILNIPYCGVDIYQTLGCELQHVDVIGSSSVGDGYGIILENATRGTTALAVYDCVFDGLFHGIITKGQQGCVFAYNYTANEHAQNGTTFQTSGYNASHGAEGMMTLWEGNFGNSLVSDNIHGAAAYQTLFRCRLTGTDNLLAYDPSKNATVWIGQGSYWWHVIGCVLGDNWPTTYSGISRAPDYQYSFSAADWQAANPPYGGIYLLGIEPSNTALDPMVANTIQRSNNFDYISNSIRSDSVTTATTLPSSLAWSEKPVWFGNCPWPAFDPGSPTITGQAAKQIPAGYRAIVGTPPPTKPYVVGQPASVSTDMSGAVSFSVIAEGFPAPSIQWQQSADGGATWTAAADGSSYSGTSTDTLVVTPTSALNGIRYRAIATSTLGSTSSESALLSIGLPPQLIGVRTRITTPRR